MWQWSELFEMWICLPWQSPETCCSGNIHYFHPILFVFASLLSCVLFLALHHSSTIFAFEGSFLSWASSSMWTRWCGWFLCCLKDSDMSWPTGSARTTWSCSLTPSEHPVGFIFTSRNTKWHKLSVNDCIVFSFTVYFIFGRYPEYLCNILVNLVCFF